MIDYDEDEEKNGQNINRKGLHMLAFEPFTDLTV